uniref:Uncharacterized protein n=1 Tax=Leersia perrieri TaxID=77586 RepID=A0A0D9V0I4_9ORYZ
MVVLADSAARKLLHGSTDAHALASDATVGMSFGLGSLWDLIAVLFSGIIHLLVLPFQALAEAVTHGFEALGHAIQALFAGIVSGLGNMAHLLVMPFEILWRGLQAAVAGIGHGFEAMWPNMQSFFANFLATVADAAHGLVLTDVPTVSMTRGGKAVRAVFRPPPMVVLADSAARKLLHGAVGARGLAAVGMSFGLDGLWELIAGLFSGIIHLLVLPFQALAAAIANGFEALGHGIQALFAGILAALGNMAHLLVMPFEMVWRAIQAAVAGIGHGFEAMWHGIEGFFAGIGSIGHLFVLPFEAFWRWIQVAAAGIGHGFDAMWHAIPSFFAGAIHGLVLPFEAFWRWLQTAVGGISSGWAGLWQNIQSFFAGAAHELVHPFEAFWKWLKTAAADVAADISFGLDGAWPLIKRLYASLLATLAGAAHDLAPRLESLWRWLCAAAATALPYVLIIVAVLCVVALVWFTWTLLCTAAVFIGEAIVGAATFCGLCVLPAAVMVGQGLVLAVSYGAHCVFVACKGAGMVLGHVLPSCGHCCVQVTMRAPGAAGAAGMVISRVAFESFAQSYFLILRHAGPVVATAVFCTQPVASVLAAPVAALFSPSR